jgi:hypothetical protein
VHGNPTGLEASIKEVLKVVAFLCGTKIDFDFEASDVELSLIDDILRVSPRQYLRRRARWMTDVSKQEPLLFNSNQNSLVPENKLRRKLYNGLVGPLLSMLSPRMPLVTHDHHKIDCLETAQLLAKKETKELILKLYAPSKAEENQQTDFCRWNKKWRYPIQLVNQFAKTYYGVSIFAQMTTKEQRTRITFDTQNINELNDHTSKAKKAKDLRGLELGKGAKANVVAYNTTLDYDNFKAQCKTIPTKLFRGKARRHQLNHHRNECVLRNLPRHR